MITIKRSNVRTIPEEIMDLEVRLFDVAMELTFPTAILGNNLRYRFATERRNIKNKINKLKESLSDERSSNY